MKSLLLILASTLAIALPANPAQAKLYEKRSVLECLSNICTGAWPKVPTGKALSVKTISCSLSVAQATATGAGSMSIANETNGFAQVFKFDFVENGIALATVQPVPMRIPSGKRPLAFVAFQGGNPISGICYLRGSIN